MFAWDHTLHEVLWRRAEEAPESVAIVDRCVHVSYRQLTERAEVLAQRLRNAGVVPGTLVALAAERGADLIIGLLGILRAGGAYVPIDPSYPAERRAFLLADSGCPVVLCERRLFDTFAGSGRRVVGLEGEEGGDAPTTCAPCADEPLPSDPLAYVIYTSGSTGKPKGVMVTHNNVLRLFTSTRAWYKFGPSDVWALFHSVSFDFSVWEIWGALLHGGRLVIVPHEVSRDPLAFRRLVREEGITVLNQTPSAFRQFLRADTLSAPPSPSPSSSSPSGDALRLVIFGGEALDFRTLRPWFERHGDEVPRLVNMYGITETTVFVTYRPLSAADADDARSLIGVPIPDLTLHLLDEAGNPVAAGEMGELWIGGAGVALGYLRRPELDQERFVPDRFSGRPGARLYRSGDLARRGKDGELEYLGRADQQIKIRGFRVELGEIEAALRSAAGVADAAVATHRLNQDEEPQLIGYVVPRAEPLDLAAVRTQIAAQLPEYMRPTVLLPLSTLPLTAHGKLDRKALPAPVRTQIEDVRYDTAEEAEIGALVGAILGAGAAGPDAHFFERGGSSLQAMQLSLRIAERLGVMLPAGTVFACPTVRALARAVAAESAKRPDPSWATSPSPHGMWLPLSVAQEQIWFVQTLARNTSAFHCPAAFRLRGPLDVERLSAALDAAAERHPILRTVFAIHDGRPMQRVMPSPTFVLERSESGAASVQAALQQPFELARAAGRALLLRTAPDEHTLLLVLHHLITDGWSMMRLIEELGRSYEGRPQAAPAASFFTHALAERRRIESGEGREDEAYWRSELLGAPLMSELPLDHARPAHMSLRGELISFSLDIDLFDALTALARAEGTTFNALFLSALYALLSRYSGQRDLIIGVPYASRDRPGSDSIQGLLLNQFALRVSFGRQTTFRELLTRTNQRLSAAYAHSAFPFSSVVSALGLQRDPSRPPLAQIVFAPQPATKEALQLRGITVESLPVDVGRAPCDLTVYLWPRTRTLDVEIEFATDLYNRDTIERFGRHLVRLLDQAVREPDRTVATLDLLDAKERRQLLTEWPGGAPEQAFDPLPALFARQAAAHPDCEALRHGTEVITYRELDERASRIAHLLRERGVGRESLVALCCERSPHAVAGVLGIWKAGGAYLPLDPAYPEARLEWMLADSRAVLLLSTRSVDVLGRCSVPRIHLDDEEAFADAAPAPPEVTHLPGDLAYVIYTSGSTGMPKGVAIEQRGLANLCAGADQLAPIERGGRIAQLASLSFDAYVHELVAAFCHAATLVIPVARHPLGGAELADFLEQQRITQALIVPSVLALLPQRRLPDLRLLIAAGERCSAELVERWIEGRAFQNNYGPSEASVCASVHRCSPGEGEPPIGRPLAATRLYVLDDADQPAVVGALGELFIGGPGLARGYLHRPELSADRFVDGGPLIGQPGRLYRTGDRVRRRADGAIEFLGRKDDQHKVRGFRVELGEVEAALRAHPEVQAAAALVDGAGGSARLLAYVVPRAASASSIELWPSVAEHFVYDELLYSAMSRDTFRNERYRAALRKHVAGRVVVDLGTGGEAILARLAIEEGAARVYAIELLEASYRRALRTIAELGLADRVHVVHGDAATVKLPEEADVCVSELVGAIGGSEGVAFLLNAARGLLKNEGRSGILIPCRSLTRIAAVRVPGEVTERPRFGPTAAAYVGKIFDEVGRPFDLRVCLRGVNREHLVSDIGVFEDLRLDGPVPIADEHEVVLRIERPGPVSGLLLWLVLYPTDDEPIDILEHQESWLPVFLPMLDEPLDLPRGTELRLRVTRRACQNGRNPDYSLTGAIGLPDGTSRPLRYELPHIATVHGGSTFYRRLWEGMASARAQPLVQESTRALISALRASLRERLPAYLVPSDITVLDTLPLTPNGKLDRSRLPAPESHAAEAGMARGDSEVVVARIWKEVLGVEVERSANFFDVGGTSLRLVEVQEKIESAFGRRIGLGELFEHTTIESMAQLLARTASAPGGSRQRPAERAAQARTRPRAPGGRVPRG